jgi:hypothetical protein
MGITQIFRFHAIPKTRPSMAWQSKRDFRYIYFTAHNFTKMKTKKGMRSNIILRQPTNKALHLLLSNWAVTRWLAPPKALHHSRGEYFPTHPLSRCLPPPPHSSSTNQPAVTTSVACRIPEKRKIYDVAVAFLVTIVEKRAGECVLRQGSNRIARFLILDGSYISNIKLSM